MKKVLALLLLCACSLLQAQYVGENKLTVNVGAPYKVVDAKLKGYFFLNNNMLSLKFQKKGIMVQLFDPISLKQKKFGTLKLPEHASYETLKILNNKLYLFYSVYNKGAQSEQLFYRIVNDETGGWSGSAKRIITTKGKVRGSYARAAFGFSVKKVDKFDFYTSANEEKFVVKYHLNPDKRKNSENYDKVGMFVFDKNMKEEWGEVLKMPYTEKKMDLMDFSVNSEGSIYVVARVYDDHTTKVIKEKSGEKYTPNYHVELLIKTPSDRVFTKSTITLDNKFTNGVWLYESPNKSMVLAGFYNTKSRDDVDGIFYGQLSVNGKVDQINTFAIPDEILAQNEHKRVAKKQAKNNKKGKNNSFGRLKLRNIIFDDDGAVTIVGEQYYVTEHTTTTANGGTTTYTYHYNDMLVTHINAEGEMEWMRKLAKTQAGSSPKGTMSFKHHSDEDFVYFFYLDHEDNKDLPDTEAPRGYKSGSAGHLVAYSIEKENGLVQKDYLLNMKDVKGIRLYQFTPTKILRISESEFVFEAYKKKKEDVLVKLTLEK